MNELIAPVVGRTRKLDPEGPREVFVGRYSDTPGTLLRFTSREGRVTFMNLSDAALDAICELWPQERDKPLHTELDGITDGDWRMFSQQELDETGETAMTFAMVPKDLTLDIIDPREPIYTKYHYMLRALKTVLRKKRLGIKPWKSSKVEHPTEELAHGIMRLFCGVCTEEEAKALIE